jgi:hypothetical protein
MKGRTPANRPTANIPTVEQSNWGRLSDLLKIKISLCDKEGNPLTADDNPDFDKTIIGVLLDGDRETESQFQTPFENINPEMKMPTMMGIIQSGQTASSFASIVQKNGADTLVGQLIGGVSKGIDLLGARDALDDFSSAIQSLEGRSNFTKVNSVQVYVSSASVRLNGTIYFQAWRDPKSEVEAMVERLTSWSLPVQLSADSVAVSAINNGFEGLFPSRVPPFVSITYGGRRLAPMLISNVTEPLVVERGENGDRLAISVPVSFLSRAAWDAQDNKRYYAGAK